MPMPAARMPEDLRNEAHSSIGTFKPLRKCRDSIRPRLLLSGEGSSVLSSSGTPNRMTPEVADRGLTAGGPHEKVTPGTPSWKLTSESPAAGASAQAGSASERNLCWRTPQGWPCQRSGRRRPELPDGVQPHPPGSDRGWRPADALKEDHRTSGRSPSPLCWHRSAPGA